MKKLVCLMLAVIMSLMFGVVAFADEGITIPIEDDDDEVIYVPSNSGSAETGDNGFELPEQVGDIINGEDHTTDLFGLDKFKPAEADTSWITPVINGVAWVTSALCGLYFAFTLLKLLIDFCCLIMPPIGRGLNNMKLGWIYSDTCAALLGLPAQEGQTLPTIDPMPSNKSGKILYWLTESLVVAVLGGVILVTIATGLLPDLISMAINAFVNAIQYARDWIRAL